MVVWSVATFAGATNARMARLYCISNRKDRDEMNYRAQNCIEKLRKKNLTDAIALLYQWVKTNYLTKGEYEDVMIWFLKDRIAP